VGKSLNCLIDTCIFIDYLRGKPSVYDIFVRNKDIKLSMSAITMMELLIGAFNKKEVFYIQKSFKDIKRIHVNEKISNLAEEYIATYSKSHNLQINDALIAATAVENEMPLVTYNISDFQYIPNIKLFNIKFS